MSETKHTFNGGEIIVLEFTKPGRLVLSFKDSNILTFPGTPETPQTQQVPEQPQEPTPPEQPAQPTFDFKSPLGVVAYYVTYFKALTQEEYEVAVHWAGDLIRQVPDLGQKTP